MVQQRNNPNNRQPEQHPVTVIVLPFSEPNAVLDFQPTDMICKGQIRVSEADTEETLSQKVIRFLERALPAYAGGFECVHSRHNLLQPQWVLSERVLSIRLTSPYPRLHIISSVMPPFSLLHPNPFFFQPLSNLPFNRHSVPFSSDNESGAGSGATSGSLPSLSPSWKNLPQDRDPMQALKNIIQKNLSNFTHVPKLFQVAEKIATQAYFDWLDGSPITHPGHIIIQGNPGVGKTTGAWALAAFLAEAAISKSSIVIEAHRDDLVDRFVGGTEFKTNQVIRAAHGGVIIFDEVYSLNKHASVNDFGKEAVTTIMKYMISEDAPIFMFLGYKKLMEEFVNMNLGFQRRIKYTIHLEDYSASALAAITKKKLEQMNYTFEANIPFETYFNTLPSGYISLRNASVAVILIEKATDRARRRTLRLPHCQRKGVARKLLKKDFDDAHKSVVEDAKNSNGDDDGNLYL